MAKLKATPKNFAQAVAVLKDRVSVRLGNNTYLEVTDSDPQHGFIGVRLHNTFIVKFWPDGQVTLHSGGWRTVTTKDRINEFISGSVYQKRHEWFYVGHKADGSRDWDNPVEFTEGMNVGDPEYTHTPKLPGIK